MTDKKLVSIICPVLNEEENVENFYQKMKEVTDILSDYDFEFIFTDNASTDNTYGLLEAMAEKDQRIRVFRFSRNFGFQKSIFTGYCKARGDCAVEYDCDLQDPPEMLVEFLKKWEEGYRIVYGIRTKRQEGMIVTFFRRLFYRIISRLSEQPLPEDVGDFMLIDRKILDELRQRQEQRPYLRGIIFSFGFRRIGIPYERHAREKGKSKFPIHKLFGLAVDGIVSQSTLPLRIASYIGIIIAFITVILSSIYLFSAIFLDTREIVPGFATLVILELFSIGLISMFLGIIGEYILRIYSQLHEKSITIISRSIDPYEK